MIWEKTGTVFVFWGTFFFVFSPVFPFGFLSLAIKKENSPNFWFSLFSYKRKTESWGGVRRPLLLPPLLSLLLYAL